MVVFLEDSMGKRVQRRSLSQNERQRVGHPQYGRTFKNRDHAVRAVFYAVFAALPSNPSSFAIGFRPSMQKAICSSRSAPRSAAP
jgi:hypothetical protein